MKLSPSRSALTHRHAWQVASGTAILAMAMAIAACGVPLDRADRPLRKDELGYKPVGVVPAPTTTTSTTTTTIVTPSSAPATTTPPPTTALVPLVYPLDVFWISPFGQIVAARRTPEGNDFTKAINALRYGPLPIGAEASLRSAIVDATMIVDAKLAGGIATIELSPEFENLPGPEQSLGIAQIVFTVTAVPTGIGRVRFRSNGRAIAVPLANGQPTTGSVSRDDYETLRGPDNVEAPARPGFSDPLGASVTSGTSEETSLNSAGTSDTGAQDEVATSVATRSSTTLGTSGL
jgi:spore germination protein GerM